MKESFKYLLLLIFISKSLLIFSQNEAKTWYFGEFAGVNFNTNPPQALSNSVLNSPEGCSVISDKCGNLLFYTDGDTIWNKNHQLMLNGDNLDGNNSATQSCIIIQQPLSNNIYYVFTLDSMAGSNGLKYSIIDINGDGGLGSVISKNNLLFSPNTEKITAVKHKNGEDIWIITHSWNSNAFFCYLLSSQGINLTPNISISGSFHFGSTQNSVGYMKASSDGSKLALAINGSNKVDIFHFDNNTGFISNAVTMQPAYLTNPYGIEFSPDSKKLYVGLKNDSVVIYQFDVNNLSITSILNSAVIVGTLSGQTSPPALQLAPDKKIYCTRSNTNWLAVINKPDSSGNKCNFSLNGINLNTGICKNGLPNFVQTYFSKRIISYAHTCFGDTTSLGINNIFNIDSVRWNFDDAASGINNFSNSFTPNHIFSLAGNYNVKAIYFTCGIPDTLISVIPIGATPSIFIGNDTTICKGDTLQLNALTAGTTYIWSNGSTTSGIKVSTAGTYSVTVTGGCGTATDDINISVLNAPIIDLGKDTTLCTGDTLHLSAYFQSSTYLWNDNTTNYIKDIATNGIYKVTVTNTCGIYYDSVNVNFKNLPQINLGNDTTICVGDTLILNAFYPNATYLWNDFSSNSNFTVLSSGVYRVMVSNDCGSFIDSIRVTFKTAPTINLGKDTLLCIGNSLLINAFYPNSSYLWSDNSINQTLNISSAGIYSVTVTNSCGFDEDSISVSYTTIPSVNLGNDTLICSGNSVLLNAHFDGATYLWYDNSTDSVHMANTTNIYWVNVSNKCGLIRDSIKVDIFEASSVSLGNDTTLCTGDIITFDATYPHSTYLWQDGTTNPIYTVTHQGIYWIAITNACGTLTDSINILYNSYPIVNLGKDTILCVNEINLDAGNPGAIYYWSNNSTSRQITAYNSGIYWVEVSNGNCKSSDTIKITFSKPELELGDDLTLCKSEFYPLDAKNSGAKYTWSTGETTRVIQVSWQTPVVWVRVEIDGCSAMDTIRIKRCPSWPEATADVPTAFSPNGDGENDILYVEGYNINSLDFSIYNRFGEKIFTTNNITIGWDGKFKGVKQDTDIYYFYLKATLSNGKIIEKKGNITLLN